MKASVIVLAALGVTLLLRNRSAAVRHWVLSAAFVCAAAVPALELVVPAWHFDLAAPSNSQIATRNASDAPQATQPRPSGVARRQPAAQATKDELESARPIDVGQIVAAAWLAGAVLSILVFVIGFHRLTALASRSRRLSNGPWVDAARQLARAYGLTRPIVILQSDHPTLLVTWGAFAPKIILPRGAAAWPADRIRIVLGHELAHICRGDWLAQTLAELLRSIYWFNPLLWIGCRRLRQESEQACDDAVLGLGVEGPEYASHLLDVARQVNQDRRRWSLEVPAAAIARPSSLERRVRAMLDARLNRAPLTRSVRLFASVALAAITLPIAGFGQTFVRVSGTVVDPNGRIIPGVTLVLSNAQRQTKYEVRSDGAGRFEFLGLSPGEYALETKYLGFKAHRETLSLASAAVQRDISLEIGSVQEAITVTSTKGATTAGPRAPSGSTRASRAAEYDPCGASPVGGCIKPPTKLTDMKPRYPQHLSDAGIGGVVRLDAVIGTDGSVIDIKIEDATDAAFGDAAAAAVRQWQFTPTQLGGVPIETHMKVTANFVIR